jgi:DNA-binding IclR family transcriptional regulator
MGEYRRRWPLHATSSGKAICAFDPESAHARIQAGFPVFTEHTIDNAAAFEAELAKVRRQGYATASEEVMLRLASVAAPVLDVQGFAVAAISITGDVAEFSRHRQRQINLVVAGANRLSKSLRHRGAPAH